MRRIQRKMLRVPRVNTQSQETEETQPSPRVDGSNKAKKEKSKLGSLVKTSKPKPSLSAKKAKASKSKTSQIKSESSPCSSKPTKFKAGGAIKTPKPTLPKASSPAMNT